MNFNFLSQSQFPSAAANWQAFFFFFLFSFTVKPAMTHWGVFVCPKFEAIWAFYVRACMSLHISTGWAISHSRRFLHVPVSHFSGVSKGARVGNVCERRWRPWVAGGPAGHPVTMGKEAPKKKVGGRHRRRGKNLPADNYAVPHPLDRCRSKSLLSLRTRLFWELNEFQNCHFFSLFFSRALQQFNRHSCGRQRFLLLKHDCGFFLLKC